MPARSQVVPDISSSSHVYSIDPLFFEILDGETRGNNLFHSFQEFSVPTGGSATFMDISPSIEHLFIRVTGDLPSELNGTLEILQSDFSLSTADLFFLNPNGIALGEQASLNLGGSFLATTAERFIFENGFEFSASDLQSPPPLTINLPIGIQFGSRSNAIVQQPELNNLPADLLLQPMKTFALLGGELQLAGTAIGVIDGGIELGSVGAEQTVGIESHAQGFRLSYQDVVQSQNIVLSADAALFSLAELQPAQSYINLWGNNISLAGSLIQQEGEGGQAAIRITAKDQLRLSATPNNVGINSIISTSTVGEEKGGDIQIQAARVRLEDNSLFVTETFGDGKAGDIIIQASERLELEPNQVKGSAIGSFSSSQGDSGLIQISAPLLTLKSSVISTGTAATGNAGNIAIQAHQIQLADLSQIGSATYGAGNAGEVVATADDLIEVTGHTNLFSSGFFASAELGSTGDGGSLRLHTHDLRVTDGGKIAANTLGSGSGGNVTIQAHQVEVSDVVISDDGLLSGIRVSAEADSTGNSGQFTLEAQELRLLNGGQISAATTGSGRAGNVNVDAKTIVIAGINAEYGVPSQIEASSGSTEPGGNINLTTQNLLLEAGGRLTTSATNSGDAGSITVNAEQLVARQGSIHAFSQNAGGGAIGIEAQKLLLAHDSFINVSVLESNGDGGDIHIKTSDFSILQGGSSLRADASLGPGGNILIETPAFLSTPNSQLSASSAFGTRGTVTIPDRLTDKAIRVKPVTNFLQTSELMKVSCDVSAEGTFAVTGKGGVPPSPRLNGLASPVLWADLRGEDTANNGLSHRLFVKAPSPNPDSSGQRNHGTEASYWRLNDLGQVQLKGRTPSFPTSPRNACS